MDFASLESRALGSNGQFSANPPLFPSSPLLFCSHQLKTSDQSANIMNGANKHEIYRLSFCQELSGPESAVELSTKHTVSQNFRNWRKLQQNCRRTQAGRHREHISDYWCTRCSTMPQNL